jgi:hypothetical protein
MTRKTLSISITIMLALVLATPVGAITGGQPDGNGHPYAALLLVPGEGFCSGTLIDEDLVLTAGHCTSFFAEGTDEVWVTFDAEAAVDTDWMPIADQGIWYLAHAWETHPGYVDADWPFTADYGLVFLDTPVAGISPAVLPAADLVDELIGTTGQTQERFYDVGYGQNGVNVGGGPYTTNFDFTRKVSEQRHNPSNGSVGTLDPMWLILGNVPSDKHGSACGGDSGSGIFMAPQSDYGNTVVAVHTGGYRLGYGGRLCGRITSLNHRVDLPVVLEWIEEVMD